MGFPFSLSMSVSSLKAWRESPVAPMRLFQLGGAARVPPALDPAERPPAVRLPPEALRPHHWEWADSPRMKRTVAIMQTTAASIGFLNMTTSLV